MSEFRDKRNELLAQKIIKGLESRNMKGYYAATKEEALKCALSIIPEGNSVTWGGTMSAAEIGLIDAVKNGDYKVFDRALCKPEEMKDFYREAYFADFFLSSANAITEDGVLVNIDGNANRVSMIAFGPEHVLFIVGMNKVARDLDAAVSRARNEAAPINTKRFDIKTPCNATGACSDCKTPDTICCQFLVTRYSKHPGRIHVILVNDNLGF